MVDAMDASSFASREDRHFIFTNGGDFCFDSGTNSLQWNDTIYILSAIAGFFWFIPPGSITIREGQLVYMELTRAPIQNTQVSFSVASQVPNSDTALIFCLRYGDRIYFRNNRILQTGECFPILSAERRSISLIPTPKNVLGVTETLVGSFFNTGSFISYLRAMLGSDGLVTSADLVVRRNSDASILTTVTSSGLLHPVSATSLAVVPGFWYDTYLKSSGAAVRAICTGIHMEIV